MDAGEDGHFLDKFVDYQGLEEGIRDGKTMTIRTGKEAVPGMDVPPRRNKKARTGERRNCQDRRTVRERRRDPRAVQRAGVKPFSWFFSSALINRRMGVDQRKNPERRLTTQKSPSEFLNIRDGGILSNEEILALLHPEG